jgi:hypothetical protein
MPIRTRLGRTEMDSFKVFTFVCFCVCDHNTTTLKRKGTENEENEEATTMRHAPRHVCYPATQLAGCALLLVRFLHYPEGSTSIVFDKRSNTVSSFLCLIEGLFQLDRHLLITF